MTIENKWNDLVNILDSNKYAVEAIDSLAKIFYAGALAMILEIDINMIGFNNTEKMLLTRFELEKFRKDNCE